MVKTIRGTQGDDTLSQNGHSGVRILGLGGNDRIELGIVGNLGGNNIVDAGNGGDTVINAFEGGNRIQLGAGNDTYIGGGFSQLGNDVVKGGGGNDRFTFQTNISTYNGGAGNDVFVSNGYRNDMIGGAGNDTISYELRHQDRVVGKEGVIIDLALGQTRTGGTFVENFTSIENAIGSRNSDLLGGTNAANRLSGLAGDDYLFGYDGNDILSGGLGIDFLSGGAGADRFVFERRTVSPVGGADRILDFSRAESDRVDLSAIDARPDLPGNQSFTFIGGAAFSGEGGEVRFKAGVIRIDIDGGGDTDMVISINDSITSMLSSDFIL